MFSGEVEALCLASPICDVIIGNIPGVHVDIQGNIDTSDEVEDNEQVPAEMLKSELPEAAVADDLELACVAETRAMKIERERPTKPLKVPTVGGLNVSSKTFKLAQQGDKTLKSCFDKIKQNKGTYLVQKGMLYRRFQRDEESEVLMQLVVPSKYRTQILQVGHETILSGHLGVKNTTDIILRNFYWPGLFGDATRFCQSCDI